MTATAEGTLARTLRVLDAFDDDAPERTAAEIAAHAGLPVSTAHRLLARLVDEGVLARTDGARYAIGTRVFELGELAPLALRLRESALPHMASLYVATGENVHLAVLDAPSPAEASVLFAGRIRGKTSVPTIGRSGGRHPLHTTGVGKALLATRDEPWLEQFLARPLVPETTRSITDPAVLRAEVELARSRGYAVARSEMTLGNVSVAAPLGAVGGLPPIAIGIVAHPDDAIELRLAARVVQAAKDLTRALRGSDAV